MESNNRSQGMKNEKLKTGFAKRNPSKSGIKHTFILLDKA